MNNKRADINTPIQNKNSFLSSLFESPKSTYFLLIICLILHLFWAWQWPILNDESYYWDWARNLKLSYVDAPPAISWVAYLGTKFFGGSLGARLFVVFLNFFTLIFLIKSKNILTKINLPHKNKTPDSLRRTSNSSISSTVVVIIFAAIPIFNINGTLLMPDAPLLLGCAGSLYFALKSCEKSAHGKKTNLSLINACSLGFFIGFGIVSKYQGAPLAIGIFAAIVCVRGLKTTIQKDLLFWATTLFFALIVASPLFIWNLQNNFASFKFQGEHGFSTWNLNIINFLLYMISVLAILLPWYSYLFIKQIYRSSTNGKFFRSLDCIPIFAFLSIFIFIASAALGKSTQVHWITPSVLFLIPLVAAHWDNLTAQHANFWKLISIFSFISIICVSSFIFTRPMQNFLSEDKTIFGYQIRKIHKGLYGNLLWANIANAQINIKKNIPQIKLAEKKYFYNLSETKCAQEPYLAGFNWRWTSQFAFYLENQPRVFSFDLKRSTYYSWRDSLAEIAGCRFFVLGPKRMYNQKEITSIMHIQSSTIFKIPQDYTNQDIEMILIEGTMKDRETLEKISKNILNHIKY